MPCEYRSAMSFGTILLIIIVFLIGGFLIKTALRIVFYLIAIVLIVYLANMFLGTGTLDVGKKVQEAKDYTAQITTQNNLQTDQLKNLYPELSKYPEFAGKAIADIKAQDLINGIEAHPELRDVPGMTQLESTARTSLELDKKKRELDDQINKIREFFPVIN